jgi:hypothetical protein
MRKYKLSKESFASFKFPKKKEEKLFFLTVVQYQSKEKKIKKCLGLKSFVGAGACG